MLAELPVQTRGQAPRSAPQPRSAPRRQQDARRGCARAQAAKHADVVRESRAVQIKATDLLTRLLQAPNPQATAQEHIASLSEEFFMVGNTYLTMATKEGNTEIIKKLETVLRLAMAEKQKTLRPEIQLLNTLLAEDGRQRRKQLLNTRAAGETLVMENRYFFSLLQRMQKDVARQPDSPARAQLAQKLEEIGEDAEARAPSTSSK